MWFVRPEGWGIPTVRAVAQGKSQGQALISGVLQSLTARPGMQDLNSKIKIQNQGL
jgi:hypothetical protein